MVIIDPHKCIGCGRCVKDCFPKNIVIKDKKAKTVNDSCFECGHCVAICPCEAVRIEGLDMDEVVEADKKFISPKKLLHLIKSRRSIRSFQDKAVSEKKLLRIIDAGRFTPTGGNRQGLSYCIIEKEMPEFRRLIIESLGQIGEKIISDANASPVYQHYAKRWIDAADKYQKDPQAKDSLFFKAPIVLLIVGDSVIDAGLAASNMELMAHAQGLGVLYSGFISRGCDSPQVRGFLQLPEDKNVLCALVIGHPNMKYPRSAPRKKATIIWK